MSKIISNPDKEYYFLLYLISTKENKSDLIKFTTKENCLKSIYSLYSKIDDKNNYFVLRDLILFLINSIPIPPLNKQIKFMIPCIYDSITLAKVIDLNKNLKLCDIGTGAGFPGLVLKIVFPNLKITLVDSLLKRIKFLNIVIEELGLSDIETIHSRAEDYVKFHRNEFDIVTCRAVSKLSNLIDFSIPLLKKNGYFIPMKANCEDELKECLPILKKKQLIIETIEEFDLPIENSHRTIIKIKK